jgi:predicted aldo/keto reductase-like oxidoreductase
MSPSLSSKNPGNRKIIYRQLGTTGIRIPIVSNGGSRHPAIIKASYDIGMRHFMAAYRYEGGLNEKRLGNTLKDHGIREDIVLATMIPTGRNYTGTWAKNVKELFFQRFSTSMERLKTGYLDILYLYNIRSVEEIARPELLEALTQLKQQKKVRYVGFTTHTSHRELLQKAIELDFYDAIIVSFNYTMSENTELLKTLEKAAQKGIGLVAMKTQCGSAWGVDGYRKPKEQFKNQTAMLKWVLHHDFITTAIPSFQTFEHMEEDFSPAYDLEYTTEEKRFLDDENIRYALGFCQQCRKCLPTCPQGVDIPTLMRIHMYAYQYQDMDLVCLAQKEIPENKGLSPCRNCKQCNAICVNSVPISRRISSLKELNWNQYV